MNQLYVTLYLLGHDLKDRLHREDRGATAVEYGLLVGLIAVVIIVAVVALGGKLNGLFESVNDQLPAAPVVPDPGVRLSAQHGSSPC